MVKPGITQKMTVMVVLTMLILGCVGTVLANRYVYKTLVKQHTADINLAVDERVKNINLIFDGARDTAKTLSVSLFARSILGGVKVDKNYIDAFNVSGKYLAVYLMNREGLTLASTDKKLLNQNYGFREYFRQAITKGEGFEVSVGVTTGQLGYYFSSVIIDEQASVSGVVVVKLNPELVDKAISELGDINLVQMITDNFGVVVSSPDEKNRLYKSLGSLNEKQLTELIDSKRFGGRKIEPLQYESIMTVISSGAKDSLPVRIRDDEDEDEESIYTHPILDGNLFLVTEVRWGSIYAAARNSALYMGVFFFGLVISVSVVLGLLLNKMLGPIRTLKKMAEKLTAGSLDEKNKVWTGDELEELGQVMERLGAGLKQYYLTLENKVKERTVELVKLQEDLAEKLEDEKNSQEILDSQNKKMALTQKAIINLLEDSREYERQLKEQKAGVEKEVLKRTEELEEERMRLVASVEALVRGYALVNMQNELVLTNKSLLTIVGMDQVPTTLDELCGKLGDKIDLRAVFERSKKNNERVFLTDCQYGNKIISIVVNPVNKDVGKEIIGMLIMFEDVTEKKALERSKDEFFSIASHELRTPLTAIRGNTAMIKDMILPKIKDKELEEMVDDIHEASVRLIGIVNDFLQVSRLEQGKLLFAKDNFDLVEVVDSVAALLKDEIDTKGLKIVRGSMPEKLNVTADKVKVTEILTNMVGNGIKYTDKGEIGLSIEQVDEKIIVRVSDTGKGIASVNQGLLFRKFQQAGENLFTRETAKSTGLGLYIKDDGRGHGRKNISGKEC